MVYPKLLLWLASRYQFRSVGGSSAASIAAALAAVAECNREGGGLELKVTCGLSEECMPLSTGQRRNHDSCLESVGYEI